MKRTEFYKCKFCADYHFLVSFCKSKTPDNNLHDHWVVTLIQEIKNKNEIKSNVNYGNYKLKYCPMCGEKL